MSGDVYQGLGEYVDIREVLPGYHYRECPACGFEIWNGPGRGRGCPCPKCDDAVVLRELAPEYADRWQFYEDDDYGIMPPPWYWPLLEDMARRASDRLHYGVNPLHCKEYIMEALPSDHPRHEKVDV